MRKRLIKLTGVLLISGASTMALAGPASAATTLATADATAFVTTQYVSRLSTLTDTSTSTGTSTLLADYGSVYRYTVAY
jgi:hypothetical protein